MSVRYGFPMITPAVKNLLLACAAVFLFQEFIAYNLNETLLGLLPAEYHQEIRNMPPWGITSFDLLFGLVPYLVIKQFYIWQFVSYMFLHGSFMHIFFNMFALWLFGNELERQWGTREFLRYYFLTGTVAGVTTFLWNLSGNVYIPTIGASGAIFGVLAAYALFFPDREIYMYFFFPIKAKYFVLLYAVLELMMLPNADGISHISHLGGMVAGFFYLRHRYRRYGIGKGFFSDFFKRKDRWE